MYVPFCPNPQSSHKKGAIQSQYELFLILLENTLQINALWLSNPPVNYGQEKSLDKKSLRCADKQRSLEVAECAVWSLTCHCWFTFGSPSCSWSSRKYIFHGMLSGSGMLVPSHFNTSMAPLHLKKIAAFWFVAFKYLMEIFKSFSGMTGFVKKLCYVAIRSTSHGLNKQSI